MTAERCTLSLLIATSYLQVYSVRAVKTAKIVRLPPRFYVALYSTENKLILLWSICVSASSCHPDDRILTACYRAASCWEGLQCRREAIRHPSSEDRASEYGPSRSSTKPRTRQVGEFAPVDTRVGEDEFNHLSEHPFQLIHDTQYAQAPGKK